MIDILLATYNGAPYLTQQLESLFNQSCQDFKILIRDDGSTDQTLSIVDAFSKKYPERIRLVKGTSRLGPKGSFSALMKLSDAPYVMFCDQDDIWKKEKIALSLKQMKQLEQKHGSSIPLLVHTDLIVINEKGDPVHPSFWKYANLSAETFITINRLLTQNVVTGCTAMMNRRLCELAYPIPECAFMHDWWVALIASLFGKIAIIRESTIYYRQHNKNAVGAKKFGSLKHILERLENINHDDEVKLDQAKYLLENYGCHLDGTSKQILEDYARLKQLSWIDSRCLIIKQKFFKCGFRRNVFCLLVKRQP